MAFQFSVTFSTILLATLLLPTWAQAETLKTDKKLSAFDKKNYELLAPLFSSSGVTSQALNSPGESSSPLQADGPSQASVLSIDIVSVPSSSTSSGTKPDLSLLSQGTPGDSPQLSQARQGSPGDSPQLSQAREASPIEDWRFRVLPNVFIPIYDGGDLYSESINYRLRFEAWNVDQNITFFLEPSYRERGYNDALANVVDPSLQNRVPADFRVDLDSDFWTLDVGLGYRFFNQTAIPPESRTTEFDLPPVSFDLMAGARIFATWNDLEVTSSGGQIATLSRQQTWAEPLVGARLRWNVSDQVALLADGQVSGFGLGDLSFSWSVKGGIDWMVSGNTSLIAGYEVSDFDYTVTSGNNSLRFDTTSHGPYLGLLFRF